MRVVRSDVCLSLLSCALGVLSISAPVRAESAEACSSAYTKGQEDRLAGRLYGARQAFKSCAEPRCPAAVVRDCKRWATEVEADLPTARLHITSPSGERIANVHALADGVPLTATELEQPLILEAGPHLLRFEAAGYRPLELQTALRPTDRELSVAVVLHALDERPAQAPKRVPVLALALAGVGALALGSSLYFGLRSHREYEDLRASCAPACNPARADALRSNAVVSDVALVAGVGALAAAAWVYVGSRSTPSAVTALKLEPAVGGARVRLRVSF